MAIGDESSLHRDVTEHASNASSAPCSPRRPPRPELKPNNVTSTERPPISGRSYSVTDSEGSDHPSEHGSDEEEEQHEYILKSLMSSRDLKAAASSGRKCPVLDRTHSARSLSSTSPLDRTYSARSLCSTAETDSSTSIVDDKTWKTLDSVHSKASTTAPTMSELGESSMDFNDSCCSFASFGGSDGSLNDSSPDLSLQRAAFTRLVEEPTPRRIMMKTQSLRTVKRGMSFRGTGLSLIEESNSLD